MKQLSIENETPKHWQIKKLGDVADYINGRAFKPTEWEKSGNPIIRIQNLNKAAAVYNYSKLDFEERYKVYKGDLLYAWSASLGVYIWNGGNAWLNQHIFKVVPKSICDKKYLFYALEKITSELYTKAHGSGMVHVTKGKFEETNILLPPLPEQQAIVSKIEELLSDLDNGKQQLQTAQQQLKVYRQSLLKWVFEGKLTNKNVKEGELPNGWSLIAMSELIEKPQYGTSKKCDYKTNGVGVLRIPNISQGNIDSTDLKFAKFDDAEIETYCLKVGDILIIRSNGSVDLVGKSALINENQEKYLFAGYLIKLRPKQNFVLPKYLLHVLSSSVLRNQIEGKAKSTSGVNNINSEELKSLIIPLCSVEEQQLIVNELESKLTVCDKIEETIIQSLLQAEALRQSILKKAFEGKLVSLYSDSDEIPDKHEMGIAAEPSMKYKSN